jgi:Flp pilus assembly protein TadG
MVLANFTRIVLQKGSERREREPVKMLKRFARDMRGNIALAVGIAAIPLLGAAGVAVDYGQKVAAQAKLQSAVDAGTLAGASSSDRSESTIRKAIEQYAGANGSSEYLTGNNKLKIQINADGSIRVEARGSYPTTMTRILGIDEMVIGAVAEARSGQFGAEVVLVLDNTKSMEGNKLTDLKSASNAFIYKLTGLNRPGEEKVKIALVPYAQYVNVGIDKKNETWLDVAPDKTASWRNCRIPGSERQETRTGTRDGVNTSWTETVWDYYPDDDPRCVDNTWTETWQGCVGSRPAPHNLTDSAPGIKEPGIIDKLCPTPITALTTTKSELTSAVSAMTTSNFWKDGATYIPIGLSWGWKTLTSNAPFIEAASATESQTKGISKHLVLMTDGINTRAQNVGVGSGTDPHFGAYHDEEGAAAETAADTITAALCENIKAQGITIYTVAFQVSDPDTTTLLRNCATSPSYYFDAGSSTELTSSFSAIADKVAAVRLSK